jgi:hypothetical protein
MTPALLASFLLRTHSVGSGATVPVHAEETRPATAEDRDRLAAARARWEAKELLVDAKPERTRQALAILDQALARFNHPFFWAGFQLQGDWH